MGIGIPLWLSLYFLTTNDVEHLVMYCLPSVDLIWWSVCSNLWTFNLLFSYYWVLWVLYSGNKFIRYLQMLSWSLWLHFALFYQCASVPTLLQTKPNQTKQNVPRRSGVINVDEFHKLFILLCIMLSVSI